MTKKEIRRAAFHLKQWAGVVKEACRDGSVEESEAALAEAQEMAGLSTKLYAMAREGKALAGKAVAA